MKITTISTEFTTFTLESKTTEKLTVSFLLNSNAQEITTGQGPMLTYRSIGGRFDFFFLPGPTPNDVVRQYQQIVGRPYLPAYWALGYQFCRYGYTGLDEVKATIKRIQAAQIPIDVVYADIDYASR
ncbi:Glycosyl hydrolase, family 31 [Aphelenchoides besseyi]|nr:Glycosyl hydrolase, family 31 [Aphelenchoides besseyi]